MKRLCIIIPTRNHADYIRYYISSVGEALEKYDVDLVIGDSSDGGETYSAVMESGNRNIIYKFYSNDVCRDGEQKVYLMFSELAGDYEYIWLCGDGYVPSLAEIYPCIYGLMDRGYEVVSMMAPDRTRFPERFKSREYLSAAEFFRDLYWHLTYWGTCLFKNTVAEYFVRNVKEIGGRKSSFVVLSSIFRYIAENGCRAYNFVGSVYSENIHKDKSTWRRRDYLLEIWARSWCDTIEELPAIYDCEKKYVMRSNDENLGYFRFARLLNWKYEGDLSLKSVRHNREYIKKVTGRPLILFYLAAIFPRALLKIPKMLYLKIMKRKPAASQSRLNKETVCK